MRRSGPEVPRCDTTLDRLDGEDHHGILGCSACRYGGGRIADAAYQVDSEENVSAPWTKNWWAGTRLKTPTVGFSGIDQRSCEEVKPGRVPVDTGTASVLAGLDQAALTSIILGVAARGAGTLTSSMPFAYFASTWAASTPSGRAKSRWNVPYATSRTK